LKGGLSMVPPWFVHGLSIDLGVFDGETMEQPWSNHGQTMEEVWWKVLFYTYLGIGFDIVLHVTWRQFTF